MSLKDIKINKRIIDKLQNAIKNNTVVHAYVFEGDLCIDKLSLAKEFAKAVLCKENPGDGCDFCEVCRRIDHDNYEDVLYVALSENGTIKDEAIESLQERLKKKPLEGDCNIAIIESADTMTTRAQNRLLKTLEEPAGNAIIVLLSENTENLVQTIRSRCVIYRINDYDNVPEGEMMDKAYKVAELLAARTPFYVLQNELEEIMKDKTIARQFLDALEYTYRNLIIEKNPLGRLYKKQHIYDAIAKIEQAKRSITANVSVGYVLKSLIIEIGG